MQTHLDRGRALNSPSIISGFLKNGGFGRAQNTFTFCPNRKLEVSYRRIRPVSFVRPFLTVTRKRKRVPESCFGCHKERQPTKNEKRNWRSFSGHTKTSVVFVCPENKFGREMAGFAFRFRFSVAVRATHGPKANLSELFSFSCRAHRKEWPKPPL